MAGPILQQSPKIPIRANPSFRGLNGFFRSFLLRGDLPPLSNLLAYWLRGTDYGGKVADASAGQVRAIRVIGTYPRVPQSLHPGSLSDFGAELDGNWASLYSKIPNQPLHQGIQFLVVGRGLWKQFLG